MATKKKTTKKVRFEKQRAWIDDYRSRRPHRSFQRTRRRDYERSLKLTGYIAFTFEVAKILAKNKRTFILLGIIYAVLTGVLVGFASQDTYSTLASELKQSGSQIFQGNLGEVGKASVLFLTVLSGSISQNSQTNQQLSQVFGVMLGLLAWLTTVWLLREIMAGHKVKLRDGLYNAGAPILSSFLVFCFMVLQLLPVGLAALGYQAATSSQLISQGGIAAAVFWVAAAGLGLLSLFWITSTLMAFVIVTYPGTYPFQALRIAGDMVTGRRVRILLRWLWMFVIVAIVWIVIMIPMILFDSWIKGLLPVIDWLPIIPITLLCLGAITIIWIASYVYTLYRKVLADAAPSA